ncbi:MAG TPA: hypothetical protein VNL94_09910 [Candidatus Binatia bacterium]|nr:hypothetical protein [Candidatus Binatia bacterium]
MDPTTNDLLLPAGTRLVHIGPHKTGTTTVQFAFHGARPALRAQGVFYPGPNSQPMFAVYAVTGRLPSYVRAAPLRRWETLVAAFNRSEAPRAVVSSEGFCDADEAAIRRIATDLDPKRIHVVTTLRPLPSLLASQWQQSVQDGRTHAYESWLDMVFRRPDSSTATAFWHRHRHDQLVERWARIVGRDRMTVIVVDDRDHEAVLRIFERLVGLAEGTLQSGHSRTNRSLTRAEIELVRALQESFIAADVDPEVRVRFVRDGVGELLKLRRPDALEPRIVTPAWAREAAEQVSREIVAGIAASGVRVIGDLARLAPSASGSSGPAVSGSAAPSEPAPPVPAALGAEIAAAAPLAVLLMSGTARRRTGGQAPAWPAPEPRAESAWTGPISGLVVDVGSSTVSTVQVRRALLGRARRWVAERLPALASAVRRIRDLRRGSSVQRGAETV